MNFRNRIRKIESSNAQNFDQWLSELPDEELEKLAEQHGDKLFSEWLTTLTDEEVETIRYSKPNAETLMRKYDEYKKQIKENRNEL